MGRISLRWIVFLLAPWQALSACFLRSRCRGSVARPHSFRLVRSFRCSFCPPGLLHHLPFVPRAMLMRRARTWRRSSWTVDPSSVAIFENVLRKDPALAQMHADLVDSLRRAGFALPPEQAIRLVQLWRTEDGGVHARLEPEGYPRDPLSSSHFGRWGPYVINPAALFRAAETHRAAADGSLHSLILRLARRAAGVLDAGWYPLEDVRAVFAFLDEWGLHIRHLGLVRSFTRGSFPRSVVPFAELCDMFPDPMSLTVIMSVLQAQADLLRTQNEQSDANGRVTQEVGEVVTTHVTLAQRDGLPMDVEALSQGVANDAVERMAATTERWSRWHGTERVWWEVAAPRESAHRTDGEWERECDDDDVFLPF